MDKILTTYFSAKGRLRRLPYFLYSLGIGVLYLLIGLGLGMLMPEQEDQIGNGTAIMIVLLILVFVILATYASFVLIIKRFHDLDKSGWMSLLMIIPMVNFFAGIYLLFFRGTDGPNQFGPPPA